MDRHLSNPSVGVDLRDFAYTLDERRSRLYHRGFVVTDRADGIDLPIVVRGSIND